MKKPKVLAYTDGACSNNPGPGGWGAYIVCEKGIALMLKGSDAMTTNNKMEILASVKALESLQQESEIVVYTDSNYLKIGITEWIHKWKQNGWKTYKKEPVKNAELWQHLLELTKKHHVTWQWVKAHSDNIGNEIADGLACMGKQMHHK
jgi:ribonuclease HI